MVPVITGAAHYRSFGPDTTLRASQDAIGRVQEQEDVAVGHREDEDEDRRHLQARRLLSTSAHGVVHQQDRQRDRNPHAADQERSPARPFQDGARWAGPNRPDRRTRGPGTKKMAGRTTKPAKNGIRARPADEKPNGDATGLAAANVAEYRRTRPTIEVVKLAARIRKPAIRPA